MSWNQRSDIVGQNKEEIKYMLFHKAASAPTGYTSVEGQFYYNTSHYTAYFKGPSYWKGVLASRNPIVSGVLLIGDTFELSPITAPAATSFVKVNTSSVASTQQYIGLADLNPVLYTTVISEPGVNTRFATEKAIVDYVTSEINALTFSPAGSNRQIQWNDSGVFGATSKLTYTENLVDVFSSLTTASLNIISTNVYTYAPKIRLSDGTQKAGFALLDDGLHITSEETNIIFEIYKSGLTSPRLLQLSFASALNNSVTIESVITNILSTEINLTNGTASKFLYLDSNKKITYVDIPSGYVSSVTDGIFDLDITAGALTINAYSHETDGCFYSNDEEVPTDNTGAMAYGGRFFATELYEGSLRVMTSHGNQVANGSFHALSNSSHNGFLKVLPAVNPTTYYLRGDNTWVATSTLNFWQRVGTTISPATSGDKLDISSGSATGIASTSTSLPAWFLNSSSAINTTDNALMLTRYVGAGTPTTDFGTAIGFTLYNSIRTNINSGRIINKWSTATSGAESSKFEWWLTSGGTFAKKMELTHDGRLTLSTLTLSGLSTYADNTAALAGGLTAGMIYKTSSGVVMVTY